MVIAGIVATQAQAREGVGDLGADIAAGKGAQAADGDHIAALEAGQAQRHAGHAGGAVVDLGDAGGRGGQGLGADLVRADHGDAVAEVVAVFTDQTGQTQLVAAGLELAGGAQVGGGGEGCQGEAGAAASAVGHAHGVGVDAGAGIGDAAIVEPEDGAAGLVFDAGQRIGRGAAVGIAHGGHAHEQLVGGHDGVVARGVADGVVGGAQAAGLQHAGVQAGGAGAGVAAADAGAAAEHGRGFAVDQTADAHAGKIGRVGLRHKAGVVVGPYRQRRGRDGGCHRAARAGQCIVRGL